MPTLRQTSHNTCYDRFDVYTAKWLYFGPYCEEKRTLCPRS